jgi:hypothetical protein
MYSQSPPPTFTPTPPPATTPAPVPVTTSPPPRAAPPPRPANQSQNNRKSVRFDAVKQQQPVPQQNNPRDLWVKKLIDFEKDFNGTLLFTTNDDSVMKVASRKMVDLCNPNREGNRYISVKGVIFGRE